MLTGRMNLVASFKGETPPCIQDLNLLTEKKLTLLLWLRRINCKSVGISIQLKVIPKLTIAKKLLSLEQLQEVVWANLQMRLGTLLKGVNHK